MVVGSEMTSVLPENPLPLDHLAKNRVAGSNGNSGSRWGVLSLSNDRIARMHHYEFVAVQEISHCGWKTHVKPST